MGKPSCNLRRRAQPERSRSSHARPTEAAGGLSPYAGRCSAPSCQLLLRRSGSPQGNRVSAIVQERNALGSQQRNGRALGRLLQALWLCATLEPNNVSKESKQLQ
ncbi:hypothetical protein MRX96_003936 [Rhipicephalus microplus]